DSVAESPWTRVSRFVTTTKTIVEFAEGRAPRPTDKIVYVCGAFDLFHVGHLSFLEEAAKLGDYLIVGILTDQVVNEYKGKNYPIMSLHERVLSVLAFKIVCQGSRFPHHNHFGYDPYEAAKRRGIYREVDSKSDMTNETIVERIVKHRAILNRVECPQFFLLPMWVLVVALSGVQRNIA
uniref:ethanolamine-phosphate cytidylyltransferase n=1 Tax=Angiostrongylus cantonensis TaxID=6313 RepID=A0A0K0DMR6_ANGCA